MRKIEKILLISGESPINPPHGGRIDIFHRLRLFLKLGIKVKLVFWIENDFNLIDYLDFVKISSKDIIKVKKNNHLWHLFHHRFPPRVLNHNPTKEEFNKNLDEIVGFSPSIIWLDNWNGFLFARRLQDVLQIPLIYRSHNVEKEYYKIQYQITRNINKKIRFLLNWIRLINFEIHIRNAADFIFDISEEDKQYWKFQDSKKSVVLPTTLDFEYYQSEECFLNDIDVLFIGNLWSSNNLIGLTWFIDEVLPLLRYKCPDIKIVFAGSSPSGDFLSKCISSKIDVIINPNSVIPLCKATKLFINPIFDGSGMGVKMLEMLFFGKPIITTKHGNRGINIALNQIISVEDEPEKFAERIIINLGKEINKIESEMIKKNYGIEKLQECLNVLEDSINHDSNKS